MFLKQGMTASLTPKTGTESQNLFSKMSCCAVGCQNLKHVHMFDFQHFIESDSFPTEDISWTFHQNAFHLYLVENGEQT